MKTATLTRMETCDEGTFGELVLFDDQGRQIGRCSTVELPWRGNKTGVSCILPGPGDPPMSFPATWRYSPKHGDCYHVEHTAGRTDVEIHSANLAGDTAKGFVSQLEGCIAPGLGISVFKAGTPPAGGKDQRGVTASRAMVETIAWTMNREAFRLGVEWKQEAS